MVTWLTRSLIFIVGGAVLAFAVTTSTITYHNPKHGATLDVHTVGAILLLVGIFDLILNFCVSLYLRDTGQPLDPYVANPAAAALGTALPGQTVTRQVYAPTPNVAVPPAAPIAPPVYAEPAQRAYVEPAQPAYVQPAQPVYAEPAHTPSHARPIHETQPIPIDPQL
ncbi:MAG TPA: hypothetical protein VGL75_14720 [Acidothermaceae bacterium]|jgi:hypothetical protein